MLKIGLHDGGADWLYEVIVDHLGEMTTITRDEFVSRYTSDLPPSLDFGTDLGNFRLVFTSLSSARFAVSRLAPYRKKPVTIAKLIQELNTEIQIESYENNPAIPRGV